jgi:hypothetical protein
VSGAAEYNRVIGSASWIWRRDRTLTGLPYSSSRAVIRSAIARVELCSLAYPTSTTISHLRDRAPSDLSFGSPLLPWRGVGPTRRGSFGKRLAALAQAGMDRLCATVCIIVASIAAPVTGHGGNAGTQHTDLGTSVPTAPSAHSISGLAERESQTAWADADLRPFWLRGAWPSLKSVVITRTGVRLCLTVMS